jgi:soluble lytic murein transglycosylase-like protein
MSFYQYSRADEIATYLKNANQSEYWTKYIYDHQTSHEKISIATAKRITHAAIVASANYGVSVSLILAVMATESGFNPNAKSRSGAIGLMQVVPYWHRKEIKGRDLYNIKTAVDVGTQIIQHKLLEAKGSENIALARYCGYRGKSAWKYISKVKVNQNILVASIDNYKKENYLYTYKTDSNTINYAGNINFRTFTYTRQYG